MLKASPGGDFDRAAATRSLWIPVFVVALENKDDPHHERAKSLDRESVEGTRDLLFHWGILFEIADGYARIGRRARGIQLLERFECEQEYHLLPITDASLKQASNLFRSRPDKEWGLTDCALFVLMAQEGLTEALTADDHFRQAGYKALLLDTQ